MNQTMRSLQSRVERFMRDEVLPSHPEVYRAFRIYDGPDEAHLQTIARLELEELERRDEPDWMALLTHSVG